MKEVYICEHCHTIWHEEQLEDNEDGTCEWCGYPLELLEAEGDNFPFIHNPESVIGTPESQGVVHIGKNSELLNMIKNIKTCQQDDVWKSIELLKNPIERASERKLFFQALKQLGKKFELKED
jgi:hypothetical protein